MIRGFLKRRGYPNSPPPYVSGFVDMPTFGVFGMPVEFLIDTGADRSIIGSFDASRMVDEFGVDLSNLQDVRTAKGVGGFTETRSVAATLRIDDFSINLNLDILEPPPDTRFAIPSLLGRDVLSHFALFIEERTDKVVLLDPAEADALGLE